MAGEDSSEITSLNITQNQNVSFIEWLSQEENAVEKIIDKNRQKIHNNYNELLHTTEKRVPLLIRKVQDNHNIEVRKISNSNLEKENDKISNVITKFKTIIPTCDYVQRIADMEQEIVSLKTKMVHNRNDCKSKISAHKKAIGNYETFFGIKFTSIEVRESKTRTHMIFKQHEQYPVTLVFDSNYCIKSFEVDAINDVAEYKELQNWFKTTQINPTVLIIKLRKLIMKVT